MVRQKFYHDPSKKHIESFLDFSGGLNTVSANVNVADNELTDLKNIDLGERGSLKRRKGYNVLSYDEIEGNIQGIFRYVRKHTPYNLIGFEGEFSGAENDRAKYINIGSWYSLDDYNTSNIIKVLESNENNNIVVNGSFENGNEGWGSLDNINGTSIVETNDSFLGTHVLRLGRAVNDLDHWKNEYQDINYNDVKEGDYFYHEAMFRKATDGDTPYRAHLVVSVYYKDGSSERFYPSINYDITGTWKRLSGYFEVPANVDYVRFGVGMLDNKNNENEVALYVDNVIVYNLDGSELNNNYVGLGASSSDSTTDRGIGIHVTGMKENAFYLFVVRYKSDGNGIGQLGIRDERFGMYPKDTNRMFMKPINSTTTDWQTVYMKFKTYDGMEKGRAYVYNNLPLGSEGMVYYDKARLYEITAEEFNKIDNDVDWTGSNAIEDKFPFRSGKLKSEVTKQNIVAANGRFYADGTAIDMENGLSIQTERPMEVVSYGNKLYIASGSGLLAYNGSTIAKVTPYIPTSMEELYIGTNALEDNPFTVEDKEDNTVSLQKIQFSMRYGVANEFINITVGTNKPSTLTLEYKFERRNVKDTSGQWFVISDWDVSNVATFITDVAGEYQFRISVREEGKEDILDEYTVSKYIIKPSNDKKDVEIDGNTIDFCNRIMVYWDRILLYGDQAKDNVLYMSDLYNPAYFPTNNTLEFQNERKEGITDIVKFRDNLVVFTKTSIQALYGKSPESYQRVTLNPDVGCIAEKGAKIVKNSVVFPSLEGIALLKSVGISDTKSNVSFIDEKIKNLIKYSENTISYVKDNQFCIVYPSSNVQLRYYYEWNVWVSDESPIFDLKDIFIEDNGFFAISSNGDLVVEGNEYQDDNYVYESSMSTRYFYFKEPYSIKKTKEIQLMINELEETTNVDIQSVLDTGDIVFNGTVPLIPSEDVYKLMSPGKGLSIKFSLNHKENKPLNITGIAFIFKLKNP